METIGKYRIEEKIGSGGFGEVFKGYDPFIKRHVAIKTCSAGDESVASRFSQEAEIGGNLHHRNITTVYDFGVHDGFPYLVQEYLSGEDLDAKIKRRDYLPFTEKLLYLLQIARGLAYAHGQGVIHRDVKPANVRILEDGTAKIMDFGIAKLAQQESGLTQTGMTLGTAAYLAPEQVRGGAVDLRTDIFSFGILAYELLTYERPFQGDQISTVLYNLLHHEPEPITAHWPGAPPELVALIDRCLRKDAGQRFADGSELVKALEKLKKRGRGGRAEPPAGRAAKAEPPRAAIAGAASGDRPPTAAGPGASGLEYRLAPDRQPARELTGVAVSARRSSSGGLAIVLVLAAVAAAAGWWLGTRGDRGAGPPPDSSAAGEAEAALGAETAGASSPAAAGGEIEPAPDSNAQALTDPAAQAPPPPATGTLILPRVPWTDRMSVRVGTRRYGLHRRHAIELPPGTYRAVFELDGDGYNPAGRTVEVQVIAGESAAVSIPIPRPGAFSVRPLPGRPQGQVSIDGEPLGPTPLSRIQREPGTYTLKILPREGEGEGLTQEVTLEPGRELILSFDLDAGNVRASAKDLVL